MKFGLDLSKFVTAEDTGVQLVAVQLSGVMSRKEFEDFQAKADKAWQVELEFKGVKEKV